MEETTQYYEKWFFKNRSQIFIANPKFFVTHRNYEILSKSLVSLGSPSNCNVFNFVDMKLDRFQLRPPVTCSTFVTVYSFSILFFYTVLYCLMVRLFNEERTFVGRTRRMIRLIDVKARCRNLKQFTCKGTLRQVFIRVYGLGIDHFFGTFSHVGFFNPACDLYSLLLPLFPSLWFISPPPFTLCI